MAGTGLLLDGVADPVAGEEPRHAGRSQGYCDDDGSSDNADESALSTA